MPIVLEIPSELIHKVFEYLREEDISFSSNNETDKKIIGLVRTSKSWQGNEAIQREQVDAFDRIKKRLDNYPPPFLKLSEELGIPPLWQLPILHSKKIEDIDKELMTYPIMRLVNDRGIAFLFQTRAREDTPPSEALSIFIIHKTSSGWKYLMREWDDSLCYGKYPHDDSFPLKPKFNEEFLAKALRKEHPDYQLALANKNPIKTVASVLATGLFLAASSIAKRIYS